MRFFNLHNKFNWKYIIGEILLIFVGISLAIWFNNWNASTKSDHAKQVAIVKIKEEIRNNIKELAISAESNRRLLDAYGQYTPLFASTTSTVRTTSKRFAMLQRKYPGFFVLTDSLAITPDEFEYHGGVHIQLEIPTLTNIAWETTKSISITNEFSYECLYELEGTYSLQERVQNETNKASDALQSREIKQLIYILGFVDQLETQLREKYISLIEGIDACS